MSKSSTVEILPPGFRKPEPSTPGQELETETQRERERDRGTERETEREGEGGREWSEFPAPQAHTPEFSNQATLNPTHRPSQSMLQSHTLDPHTRPLNPAHSTLTLDPSSSHTRIIKPGHAAAISCGEALDTRYLGTRYLNI